MGRMGPMGPMEQMPARPPIDLDLVLDLDLLPSVQQAPSKPAPDPSATPTAPPITRHDPRVHPKRRRAAALHNPRGPRTPRSVLRAPLWTPAFGPPVHSVHAVHFVRSSARFGAEDGGGSPSIPAAHAAGYLLPPLRGSSSPPRSPSPHHLLPAGEGRGESRPDSRCPLGATLPAPPDHASSAVRRTSRSTPLFMTPAA